MHSCRRHAPCLWPHLTSDAHESITGITIQWLSTISMMNGFSTKALSSHDSVPLCALTSDNAFERRSIDIVTFARELCDYSTMGNI
ncbi:unnamed protein product [Caenorhabditis nigoni]